MCNTLAEGGPCYSHANARFKSQEKAYSKALDNEARDAGVPVDASIVADKMSEYDQKAIEEQKNYQSNVDTAKEKMLSLHSEAMEAMQEYKTDRANAISVGKAKNNVLKVTDAVLKKMGDDGNGAERAIPTFQGYPAGVNIVEAYAYSRSAEAKVEQARDLLKEREKAFDKRAERELLAGSLELRSLKRKADLIRLRNDLSFHPYSTSDEEIQYDTLLDTAMEENKAGRYSDQRTFKKEENNLVKYSKAAGDAYASYGNEMDKFKEYLSVNKFKDAPQEQKENAMYGDIRETGYKLKTYFDHKNNGDSAYRYYEDRAKYKVRKFHDAKDKYTELASSNTGSQSAARDKHYNNVVKESPLDPLAKKEFEQSVFLKSQSGKELKRKLDYSKKQLMMTSTYRKAAQKKVDEMDANDPKKHSMIENLSKLNNAHNARVALVRERAAPLLEVAKRFK